MEHFARKSCAGVRPRSVEKAAYEIAYELNSRPDWVVIPIEGILQLMEVQNGNHET